MTNHSIPEWRIEQEREMDERIFEQNKREALKYAAKAREGIDPIVNAARARHYAERALKFVKGGPRA